MHVKVISEMYLMKGNVDEVVVLVISAHSLSWMAFHAHSQMPFMSELLM